MCFCDSIGRIPVYTSPLYRNTGYYDSFAPGRSVYHATAAGRVVPGSSRSIFGNLFARSRPAPTYFPGGTHFATQRPMHGGHAMPRPVHMPAHRGHPGLNGRVRAPGLF